MRNGNYYSKNIVVPGFTRKVGNYGRYGASAARLGMPPEKKFFDTALSFTFDLTGEVPATGQLSLIQQGDTESTRDGRIAIIKSVQIRGTVTYVPGAAANATTAAYMYLVLDTQTNGAAASITDVFTSNVMDSNFINLNNSGRFRILKKWCWTFNAGAGVTAAYCSMLKTVEFYKRCNIKMDWSSTTGALTELRSNNLFLMAGSVATDDLVTFNGNCRLRFVG